MHPPTAPTISVVDVWEQAGGGCWASVEFAQTQNTVDQQVPAAGPAADQETGATVQAKGNKFVLVQMIFMKLFIIFFLQ